MSATPSRPSFGFGLGLPFQAVGLIAGDVRVLGLALLPFFIAIGVTIWLGGWMKGLLAEQAGALLGGLGLSLDGVLGTIIGWITGLFAWVAAALLMPFVTTLAAVPVNDFLAEATEPRASPPLEPAPAPNMGQRVAYIWMDLVKTLAALGLMIPMVLLAMIPGGQLIAFPVLWLIFTFNMLAYPMSRRGENLGAGVAFVKAHLGASFGLGLVCSLLAAFPFISYLMPPLAVVGGTLLYARAVGSGSWPTRSA